VLLSRCNAGGRQSVTSSLSGLAENVWAEAQPCPGYLILPTAGTQLCKSVQASHMPSKYQAITPFSHCPSTAFIPVWPQCANARRNKRQEDHNSFLLGELEETTRTPAYYVDEDYPAGSGWSNWHGSESSTLETDVYFTTSCTGLTSWSKSSTSLLLWFAGVWRTKLRRIWETTAFRSPPSAANT